MQPRPVVQQFGSENPGFSVKSRGSSRKMQHSTPAGRVSRDDGTIKMSLIESVLKRHQCDAPHVSALTAEHDESPERSPPSSDGVVCRSQPT
jgi:hypothetical protein